MMTDNILHGPKTFLEITEKNLAKLIHEKLKYNKGESILFIDKNEKITNETFLNNWKNTTFSLKSIGLKQGENVAIVAENSWKFSVALLSCLALGTPVHLINPDYTTYELKHLLNLSKPKLIFCCQSSCEKIKNLQKDLPFVEIILNLDEAEKEEEHNNDVIGFSITAKREHVKEQFFENIDPKNQVTIICNSSGTTGLPKGVMMTHEAYINLYVYQLLPEYAVVRRNECQLLYLPFFHGYGAYLTIAGLLTSNVTNVILKKFQPEEFISSIEKYSIRSISVVPTILNFLATTPLVEKYDLSCLKEIFCSGAASRGVDRENVCNRFNLESVRNLYGMGEGVLCISTELPGNHKKDSVGKLFPGRQLKIVDRENNRNLGPNVVGEICVKHPVCKGYVNDEEKTNESFDEEGFLFTGDAGYYDEDGYIYLVDRLKDIIKYKSFQVAPTELEYILQKHPKIKDVAVIGAPDEKAGELAVAFIVKEQHCSLSQEEVCLFLSEYVCYQKRLHGGVRFVDSIPKNATGKILRKSLREMLNQK